MADDKGKEGSDECVSTPYGFEIDHVTPIKVFSIAEAFRLLTEAGIGQEDNGNQIALV
jgi:hypothetical protein